tara:strand:+ start:419 stop:781 length:363 start_codon:yes stop_codon:yes gene_type:complete
MSKEKGTMENFNLNKDILLVMVEERFNKSISVRDVCDVVNRSYGIRGDIRVNILKYSNELARMSKIYKEENNILHTFFDITLGLITKKLINTDEATKKLDVMIKNSMCKLTGNNEHKNEN